MEADAARLLPRGGRSARPTPAPASCSATSPRPRAGHVRPRPSGWRRKHLAGRARAEEDERARRQFMLTWVQPGLAGLMDGSVSTLAPIFATAFATQRHLDDLPGRPRGLGRRRHLDGLHRGGADDGVLSGRGSPLKRGLASGVMTTLGGLGHALPYLIPHFWTATAIAIAVVVRRALGHRLDPEPLHGDAVPARRPPGRARRRAGLRGRHPDRQRVSRPAVQQTQRTASPAAFELDVSLNLSARRLRIRRGAA